MPWYEYISNTYIADTFAMLWRDYSIIIGFAGGVIGTIVKNTKTKRDDKVWAEFKALIARRRSAK